jgi:hypothetical protein
MSALAEPVLSIQAAVTMIQITANDTVPEHEAVLRLREHARTLEHHCNVRLSELHCDADGVVLRH